MGDTVALCKTHLIAITGNSSRDVMSVITQLFALQLLRKKS
jgi:hypothetical protein